MIRGFVRGMLSVLALTGFIAAPAFAGNIALTGHDDDLHCDFEGGGSIGDDACQQLLAMVTLARNGSSLPVLAFDQGSELTFSLGALGIPFMNVDPLALPAGAAGDVFFNNTLFSAFIEASDINCGGCDNTSTGEANINSHAAAIATFFNNGGGIVGLAGAADFATYYNFLPASAGVGSATFSMTGFFATGAACTIPGFTAVNGDQTHNYFPEPGVSGLSPLYCVAERGPDSVNGVANAATTLLLRGGTIVTSVITTTSTTTTTTTTGSGAVPEPGTLGLLGLGVVAAYRQRRLLRRS